MDIASYSGDSRAVIKSAREVAAAFRHPEIDVEHLLVAVVRHEGSEVEGILSQLGKSRAFIEGMTEQFLKDQSSRASARDNLTISPAAQESLNRALDEKAKLYDTLVEPEHIFLAVFDPRSALSPYLRDKLGIQKEDIYRAIAEGKAVAQIASSTTPTARGAEAGEEKRDVAGTLRYCVDITSQAAAGEFDPVIGRDKEIQQAMQILLRRRKNSPILVGGPGVGKTAIIEGFAQLIIEGKVPTALKDVKIMQVDMGSLVAGAKYKGEFEERFKSLVGEVVKSGGKIILFIDEIHTIMSGAATGGSDAANLIKPPLARGQIRLAGATTEEEYTKYIEKDKALERRFEKVKIEEPSLEVAIRIAQGVASKYEGHHKITYTPEAITGAVRFAKRYLSEKNLPDVALDIIDEAGSAFGANAEVAKRKIGELQTQIPEIEKLIAACDGKNPEKEKAEFEKLHFAYDDFSRGLDLVQSFWGHRVDALTGGGK